MEIHGIDVSRHQGEVNWFEAAAAGIRFAGIRASVGDYYSDPNFDKNWTESFEAQVYGLAYHAMAPERPVTGQVKRFIAKTGANLGLARAVLDIELVREQTNKRIIECTRGCLKEIADRTGKKPLIYSNPYFVDTFLLGLEKKYPEFLEDHEFWVANYRLGLKPLLPKAVKAWRIWQYTKKGRVSGIKGDVDRNYFNGDEAEFMAWTGQKPLTLEERVVRLERAVFGAKS
jgi:lysozyme